MKAHQPAVRALVLLLLLLAVYVTGASIAHSFYRYAPGVEHESAFLRTYNPRPVIESFASREDPIGLADGIASGAGRKFVTTQRKIDPMFALRNDMRLPLMIALSEDMAAQLARNGATILARSGNPQDGFRMTYREGTSSGTVTLSPLEESEQHTRNGLLPEGTKTVHSAFVIAEKWFPSETAAIRADAEPGRSTP